MRFRPDGRLSLRYSIILIAGSALMFVSIVLIAYSEIHSAARIHQIRTASLKAQADLVQTMLELHHERLGVLARRMVSDPDLDSAIGETVGNDLEKFLDLARADRPMALAVVSQSGEILADSIARSVFIDKSIFSDRTVDSDGSDIVVTPDGKPVMRYSTPVRRGDDIVAGVRIVSPLETITEEFFPGLDGLAFRSPSGLIESLYGYAPEVKSVPSATRTKAFHQTSGKSLEGVFLPLDFGDRSSVGDLVLLKDITGTVRRENIISRMMFVAIFVVIAITLGMLVRALRIELRPLGTVIHALETMSRGETVVKDRDMGSPSISSPSASAIPAHRHEIGILLKAVESFRASIDTQNALIAMREQLDNAWRIQQSLLPSNFDVTPGLDTFGTMRPALDVAGDFFDVFSLEDGRIAVLIADVSCKGLAPALFAAQASAVLRTQSSHNSNPETAIRLTNEALCDRNPEDMFLTCVLAFITPENGAVSLVNAGHCHPVVVRRGGSVEQVADGLDPDPILGIVSGLSWNCHQFDLEVGDRLILYSDGFVEACNRNREERVIDMFSDACSEVDAPSEGISTRLFEKIDKFADGAPQADDITIVMVRRLSNPEK